MSVQSEIEIGGPSPSSQPALENPNGSPPVDFGKKKKKKIPLHLHFTDKYEMTGMVLGEGATSVVRECRDLKHSNMFAAKSILKTSSSFNRDRMLAEISILLKCKGQETIIQMMEYFEDERCFTLVFEKIGGGPLMSHIKASKIFTERDASNVIENVATALAFLHKNGIAHRDIKPDNILCVFKDKISPVKLVDFDLSYRQDAKEPPRIRSPVGTPEFMAPEIAQALQSPDHQPYDELCDVWSLGVILHMMLVGAMPFVGKCGQECGWGQGSPCELCAEDLLENIAACKRISFDAEEWQRVTGGAKDLLSRMLVRASQRITARQILEHPWVCQSPPMTPLATPARLGASTDAGFNTFLSDANDKLRKMEPDTIVCLGAPGNALYRRRTSSRALLAPFAAVKNRDLSEIHTPKFPIVSPPDARGERHLPSTLSSSLSIDDLQISP